MVYTIKLTQGNQIKEVATIGEFAEAKKFIESSILNYSVHWVTVDGKNKVYQKAD